MQSKPLAAVAAKSSLERWDHNMATAKKTPDACSTDYEVMRPFWHMVNCLLDGLLAVRRQGVTYLPKFVKETQVDYDYRLKNVKFTNLYRDIIEGLAAKPFQKEVQIKEGSADDAIAGVKKTDVQGRVFRSGGLIEDIDGRGNHLHVFLSHTFFMSINNGIDWILVDKAPLPEGATIADEKLVGARPYWVHLNALQMLAVYSDTVDGKEEFIHVRIWEPETIRDGFGEEYRNRVRIFNRAKLDDGSYGPATWELWEEERDYLQVNNIIEKKWFKIAEGNVGIAVIPLVPLITGRRKGDTWQIIPPMQDVAYLQIKHYQSESNLNCAKERACFPMLAGNGVDPDMDAEGNPKALSVGPMTVLYAPPGDGGAHGEWVFIEPSAESLKFLQSDIDNTERQMREIGRQPLTNESGNLTVVTTAFAASKGNSVIQAWVNDCEDAAEQAFVYTCMWLGDKSEPEVIMYKDFAIDLETDQAPTVLLAMRESRDISRVAMIREAKRRDWLSPEYDAEVDQKELDGEPPPEPVNQNTPPANKGATA